MATTFPIRATVIEFDSSVGLGTVRSAAGGEHGFHAAAISDGTRDIAVGAVVLCQLGAGHRGITEARAVTPLTPEPTRT